MSSQPADGDSTPKYVYAILIMAPESDPPLGFYNSDDGIDGAAITTNLDDAELYVSREAAEPDRAHIQATWELPLCTAIVQISVPQVGVFVACPSCKAMISHDEATCPSCNVAVKAIVTVIAMMWNNLSWETTNLLAPPDILGSP